MKSNLSFLITLAIGSSANAYCDHDCQLNQYCNLACRIEEISCRSECPTNTDSNNCFDECFLTSNECYSKCPGHDSSTNGAKITKSSSLRGSSALLTDLENLAKRAGSDQNINLIKEESQCGDIFSPCKNDADCCGSEVCQDFGAPGIFSYFLCNDDVWVCSTSKQHDPHRKLLLIISGMRFVMFGKIRWYICQISLLGHHE